jgi:hypothetical protein
MRPIVTGAAVALLSAAAIHPAAADCICRARGITVTHGQTVCIPTPEGTRLARCEMVSNVASWKFLDAPCPQASIGYGQSIPGKMPVGGLSILR